MKQQQHDIEADSPHQKKSWPSTSSFLCDVEKARAKHHPFAANMQNNSMTYKK
jgi:hypothetical protein